MRSATVNNEDGSVCATMEARGERWRRHFTQVLNIHSQFSEEELCRVRQRPVRAELANEDEVWSAIGNRMAEGISGILPEMVKAAWCEDTFRCRLVELVEDVWKESSVPCDWRDAILVPIPDLTSCDNWRGISLLEVVGKVVARVIQERL